MYIVSYTTNDGITSYYVNKSKNNFNKNFFYHQFGVRLSNYITHLGKIEDAKKFKTKSQAKKELQTIGVDYYSDDRYSIIEVEG